MLKEIVLEEKPKKIKTVDPLTKKKIVKYKCPPHFKLDKSGSKPTCRKMSGDEIIAKKKALKKALQTKKQGGEQKKAQMAKKRLKTLKIKKAMGL
jgi:hypothetical protein